MTRRPWLLPIALLGVLLLPLPASADTRGQVVANGLRLRSEPNGRQIGLLQHGEIVTVHAKRGSWLGVRSAAGRRGWVFSRYVRPLRESTSTSVAASAPRGETARTTAGLRLRPSAGTSGDPIAIVPEGATVEVIGRDGNWRKVRWNGRTGWLYSDYLSGSAAASSTAASAPRSTTRGETARTTTGLRLRPSPGTSGAPIAIVPEGATVEVIGRDGNWRKVTWNGRTGWLYSDYLRSSGDHAHGARGAVGVLEGHPANDPAPTGGRIDTTNLSSLHPTLRAKVERVLRRLQAKGWQPYVAEGKRTRAEQAEKVRLGYSRTMNSRHLTGRAADIVDRRYGWGGRAANQNFQFWRDLGAAARAEGLTWGGDWRSFKDVAHVQL